MAEPLSASSTPSPKTRTLYLLIDTSAAAHIKFDLSFYMLTAFSRSAIAWRMAKKLISTFYVEASVRLRSVFLFNSIVLGFTIIVFGCIF